MFCIKCGVKMTETQATCPLCGTKMILPEDMQLQESLYPQNRHPSIEKRSLWPHAVIAALFLLPMLIVMICNYQLSGRITWAGFVVGALLLVYVSFGLPGWFRKPNPVIFTPCAFAALEAYLLYINLATGGNWFLTFAFPVAGAVGLIVTAVVTLVKYVRRGVLYIFGGAVMALGLFMPVMEYLLTYTFPGLRFLGWSFYPLVVLVLLGGVLIFLAICRPAREMMERNTFL